MQLHIRHIIYLNDIIIGSIGTGVIKDNRARWSGAGMHSKIVAIGLMLHHERTVVSSGT